MLAAQYVARAAEYSQLEGGAEWAADECLLLPAALSGYCCREREEREGGNGFVASLLCQHALAAGRARQHQSRLCFVGT